jgi:hypothetical protein
MKKMLNKISAAASRSLLGDSEGDPSSCLSDLDSELSYISAIEYKRMMNEESSCHHIEESMGQLIKEERRLYGETSSEILPL